MPVIKQEFKEDAILYRFDPDSPTPKVRGMAYYERSFFTADGVEMSGTSKDGDAQPVSIAKGVPGLDLDAILGKLAAGLQALCDEQSATIAAQHADLKAKDDNAQLLLGRIAELEARCNRLQILVDAFPTTEPGEAGSAAESATPAPEAPSP
jgi:hypothetical protein